VQLLGTKLTTGRILNANVLVNLHIFNFLGWLFLGLGFLVATEESAHAGLLWLNLGSTETVSNIELEHAVFHGEQH
jgi:hypothetical protein